MTPVSREKTTIISCLDNLKRPNHIIFMIALKNLLNMIATEAAEANMEYRIRNKPKDLEGKPVNYKPMDYNLRVVRNPDGTLDWAE